MKRPAILFITTDEQHADTVYRRDLPYELPGLQGLMACSDVYANAYSASPVCLPARCAWMTGMMPHRNGNISNRWGAALSRNFPNLFTELKKSGYTTSMHGKCHFAPCPYPAIRKELTQEYAPFIAYYQSLGMDHLDLQDDKNVSMWYYDHYAQEMERKGHLARYRQRFVTDKTDGVLPDHPWAAELHPDSWTGQKALDYLDTCSKDQPHFMWVSFSGPHYPMDAPQAYCDRIDMTKDFPRRWQPGEWADSTKHGHMGYEGTGGGSEGSANAPGKAQKNYTENYWRTWRQKYYANVVQIDEYIEKIIAKARSIWQEDLYIVFSADHGDMMGNHSSWGKRACLYEDVLKVPLIVHHPGQRNGREITETVSSVDVFASLLQAGGCPLPAEIDGRPLDEVTAQGGRETLFSSCEGRVALMHKGMKLCYNDGGPDKPLFKELYDLAKDPDEYVNRYYDPAYQTLREELEKRMAAEPHLLRSAFWTPEDKPYWLDDGCGTGYAFNHL